MAWFSRLIICLLAVVWPALAKAQDTEKRIALVIGNAAYQAGPLNTASNDAGLIAQTLEAAGFDVVGARDLDQDTLRRAFRDFLDKAQASGPNTGASGALSKNTYDPCTLEACQGTSAPPVISFTRRRTRSKSSASGSPPSRII